MVRQITKESEKTIKQLYNRGRQYEYLSHIEWIVRNEQNETWWKWTRVSWPVEQLKSHFRINCLKWQDVPDGIRQPVRVGSSPLLVWNQRTAYFALIGTAAIGGSSCFELRSSGSTPTKVPWSVTVPADEVAKLDHVAPAPAR